MLLRLAIPALLLISIAPQDAQTLKWNVPKDGAVGYRLALENADPGADGKPVIDFEKLTGRADLPEEMKKFLQQLPTAYTMTLILQPAEAGRLGVKMVAGDVKMPAADEGDEKQKEWNETLKKMMSGVQLRAQVTETGEVASWWLDQKQANLAALFLQLPDRPVKPGDTWSIGVRFLSMGHGYVHKKADRINRVRFVSLTPKGDDRVATVEYLIAESVEGDFVNPMTQASTPTTMRMSFVGSGEFLVRAGRWSRLTGRLSYKATGFMTGESEQKCALELLDKVPPELLKLK